VSDEDEAPVEEAPVYEVPVEEVPVAEIPVAEVPVAEVPVEEAPVEEVPVVEPAEDPAAVVAAWMTGPIDGSFGAWVSQARHDPELLAAIEATGRNFGYYVSRRAQEQGIDLDDLDDDGSFEEAPDGDRHGDGDRRGDSNRGDGNRGHGNDRGGDGRGDGNRGHGNGRD
jgi:hypothetical protein